MIKSILLKNKINRVYKKLKYTPEQNAEKLKTELELLKADYVYSVQHRFSIKRLIKLYILLDRDFDKTNWGYRKEDDNKVYMVTRYAITNNELSIKDFMKDLEVQMYATR